MGGPVSRRGMLGAVGGLGLLAACGSPAPSASRAQPATPSVSASRASSAGSARALLAYFSRPGENYHYGGRINLTVGNTQVVADMIAAAITVDGYRIEAAERYPDDYEQTVQRNTREARADARPRIANPLLSVADYDTVLLGCPVWAVQTPMIMRTFVEGVDLAGKTVHPFVTHAVSGIGRVRNDYVELLPDSTISEGLVVQGEAATQARPEVEAWLNGLGLL